MTTFDFLEKKFIQNKALKVSFKINEFHKMMFLTTNIGTIFNEFDKNYGIPNYSFKTLELLNRQVFDQQSFVSFFSKKFFS